MLRKLRMNNKIEKKFNVFIRRDLMDFMITLITNEHIKSL